MDTVKQIQILEELQRLSVEISNLIIEKTQNRNMFDERLKVLYARLSNLYKDFNKLITPLNIPSKDES
jgi:hypothetical protein